MDNRSGHECEQQGVSIVPQAKRVLDFNIENASNHIACMNKVHEDLERNPTPIVNEDKDYWFQKINFEMEFETLEDAYNSYNQFGAIRGFSIRKRYRTTDTKTGVIKRRVFVCSKEGERKPNKRDYKVKHHCDETRTDCESLIVVTLGINDKYQITDFHDNHNHHLTSPDKVHMLRSQRKIALAQAATADDCDKSEIRPKSTYDLLSRQAGGRKNVGFLQVDYKNYLRTKRMKTMEMFDAGGLIEYFKSKQIEDPTFFYSMQLDAEDSITNIFWAYYRMLIDYELFGDAVCFDTTYKTNGYGRPFAPFVGVNHHWQTIIFGAALLYDETIDSFVWLFETFCQAMFEKTPLTIFTDQDKAMSAAIQKALPRTAHRICVWHMFQNALKHLTHVFSGSKSFLYDFSSCIYDYEEEEEFFEVWDDMLAKYDLQSNYWLKKLFEETEKWALAYGRNTFCADMKSTQRSESLNKELKHYLDPRKVIADFFCHFERLLVDRRFTELEANFKMTQMIPSIKVPVSILKHAALVYTPSIYKMFEEEYLNGLGCEVEETNILGTIKRYCVTNAKGRKHNVTFDHTDETVTCSCKKFEFAGILCGHALMATIHKCKQIPMKYILKRWTREAVSSSFLRSSSAYKAENHKKDISRRYNFFSIIL